MHLVNIDRGAFTARAARQAALSFARAFAFDAALW
jgi:hypothetical protein